LISAIGQFGTVEIGQCLVVPAYAEQLVTCEELVIAAERCLINKRVNLHYQNIVVFVQAARIKCPMTADWLTLHSRAKILRSV
jgi:hypothetical protein